jgi:hypothetical protein
MSTVTRDQIIAAAAVKKFKRLVDQYKGPPARLRTYLIRYLHHMETKADAVLAEGFDELLGSA